MTDQELYDRYRQWRSPVLSMAECDEWARLEEEANTVLTEAEWDDVLEEATFPVEVLNLSDEDHARIRDGMNEEGMPFFHERVLIESLRRRIAAKKEG